MELGRKLLDQGQPANTVARDETKTYRLTRSELVAMLRSKGVSIVGIHTVSVERGDELIDVNNVDGIVVSWMG
jgi:hypothetical protein